MHPGYNIAKEIFEMLLKAGQEYLWDAYSHSSCKTIFNRNAVGTIIQVLPIRKLERVRRQLCIVALLYIMND